MKPPTKLWLDKTCAEMHLNIFMWPQASKERRNRSFPAPGTLENTLSFR